MSPKLIGIFSVGVTLLAELTGLGGLIIGSSLWLHGELRSDQRQLREENARQHRELGARIDALTTRVNGLSAQS